MRGPEAEKAYPRWAREGMFVRYLHGNGLDIGFKGSLQNAEPICASAIGIDRGYPGYDLVTLPFPTGSQDFVFSSHCLEHIHDAVLEETLKEWYRVLKVQGHLVLYVPHQYLYEKKEKLPSRWNGDHQRFLTPGTLLTLIESILVPNSYEVVYCKDCRANYDYSLPPETHAGGEYSIECVIKKIKKPKWKLS